MLKSPLHPFASPAIHNCHNFRLGNNYAKAKADSFPAVQKKLRFIGGPKVDKVTGEARHLTIWTGIVDIAAVIGDG